MARLGLGPRWRCLKANDINEKKARTYALNFPPGDEYLVKDVAEITMDELRGAPAALAWASFPCQDLSLAGPRNGLKGVRSGTFWPFWNLIRQLRQEGRSVPLVVLENVVGAISSHDGKDFKAIIKAFADEGYCSGAIVIDAINFLPQSRPRLFIIGAKNGMTSLSRVTTDAPSELYHPESLFKAYKSLPRKTAASWVWWKLPAPPPRSQSLDDIIEEEPMGVDWHPARVTKDILNMMSERNLEKVREAKASGERIVGTIYKRTRKDDSGNGVQRAEVRFDQISGCLRTPAGGSSRQTIIVIEGRRVRTRLISLREAARLMGVPDSYMLPENYNEAYHLMGDGLAVPAVSWLERHVLRPLAKSSA